MERNYPTDAGWTDSETGREAAQEIDATTLRRKCLPLLREKAMTPDECAKCLGIDWQSIRPRFTELKLLGVIEDTGERRRNDTGKRAKVWRLKRPTFTLEFSS